MSAAQSPLRLEPLELMPVGDRAALVEVADNDHVQSLSLAARARWGGELAELVAGERTLLIVWRGPRPTLAAVLAELRAVTVVPQEELAGRLLVIGVRYDGADLRQVARLTGLRPDEVVALHTAPQYTVAFIGFAPGFGYLRGGDPRLAVPRLVTPRERVAAGSVAIAAGYSAVYPTDSPGGWQILGHTETVMFDPDRDPPVLLEPGTRVRFEAIG